jgi:NTE family protein
MQRKAYGEGEPMKVGLALSGGGVKGAAHIGVLRCFIEHGIPVDLVSGASAGAIAAGLYAAGMDPDDMEQFALGLNKRLLDYDLRGLLRACLHRGEPLTGLIKGDRLHRALLAATGGRLLTQAHLPLAISATDLDGGDLVLFVSDSKGLRETPGIRCLSEGRIADAVAASAAIPVVFSVRQAAGMRLVDGGALENIPVNVLLCMGADIVVAVDLSRAVRTRPASGLLEVGQQTLSVISRRLTDLRTICARVVITPDMTGIGTFEFGEIPLCISRGYEAALKALDSVKKAMVRHAAAPPNTRIRPYYSV